MEENYEQPATQVPIFVHMVDTAMTVPAAVCTAVQTRKVIMLLKSRIIIYQP
jgi:hypothetical protein